MKVKELIEKLQKMDQELQVRLIADHSQAPMICNVVCNSYITADVYLPDEIHVDDLEAHGDDAIPVVVLEAF